MNDQLTKDPVGLDDLKRAIAEYQKAKAAYEGNCSLGWDIADARADAWLTAFEWLYEKDYIARSADDHLEGMRLIREKLQS